MLLTLEQRAMAVKPKTAIKLNQMARTIQCEGSTAGAVASALLHHIQRSVFTFNGESLPNVRPSNCQRPCGGSCPWALAQSCAPGLKRVAMSSVRAPPASCDRRQ